MEKIKSAAIKFKLKQDPYQTDNIVTGATHAMCMVTFKLLNVRLIDRHGSIQGFMTTEDRFVDREKALEIAKLAKQVPEDYPHNELFSEDLDFNKRNRIKCNCYVL